MGWITGYLATSDLDCWLDPDENTALQEFLLTKPEIERLDRYRFRLNQREVDFHFTQL